MNSETPKKNVRPDSARWPGGYIRTGKNGQTYVIDRWVNGIHFHVSTRCRAPRAAMKQLERFEMNPVAYRPAGEVERVPLVMSAELILEYRDWMELTKGTTREWANDTARLLTAWMIDLNGKDLRDVSMQRDLKPALIERKTSHRHRIEAIKSFYAWLRKEKGSLAYSQDPTLDLPVPQVVAEKHKRRKVVDRELPGLVMQHLPQAARDVLMVQLCTAWHVSEVRRFAEHGEILRPEGGKPLAVLSTHHKSQKRVANAIHYEESLEAAQRLRALGGIPRNDELARALKAACTKAEVAQFRNGVMRHSVLTWAHEMGATIQQVADFAHHASPSTTKTFYLDAQVPPTSIPTLRLLKGA